MYSLCFLPMSFAYCVKPLSPSEEAKRYIGTWETPESIPHLPLPGGILLSLLVVACAVYQLPFSPAPLYTVPLLIACVLALIGVVRSIAVGVAFGALFVCGFAFGGFSLSTGLALVCPVIVMGLGAYLISTYRSKWLFLLPVLAYACAFALCRDAAMSLISLISFPAAGILAYQTMRHQGRVSVICSTSLLYGLCYVFGYVLLLFLRDGAVSLPELAAQLDALRESTVDTLLQNQAFIDALENTYASVGLKASDVIEPGINLVFNLLPGLLICLVNIMAYTAQLTCVRAYTGTGMKSLASRTAQLFVLSVFSGLVYLFCFVITLFSGASNMFTATVQNLLVILLPGMTLVGVFKLISDVKHGVSRLWLLILIGCAVIMPYMLILCISFSGALTTVTRPLITRMIVKTQGKDGPSDPTDAD